MGDYVQETISLGPLSAHRELAARFFMLTGQKMMDMDVDEFPFVGQ